MDSNFKYAIVDSTELLATLIKGFNSVEEIEKHYESTSIEFDEKNDLVMLVDPSVGLHPTNIIAYAEYYHRQIQSKEEFEKGDINEEDYKNELWQIESRVKKDVLHLDEMVDKHNLD